MKKQHVVYVVSRIASSAAFEQVALGLRDRFRLTFILLGTRGSALENFLQQNGIEVMSIPFRGKKDYFFSFIFLFSYFLRHRPDVVHTHLLDAQIAGLPAAAGAFINKRIYTRHTSNFHHVFHPKGIVYDRFSNWIATHIVSISQATYDTLVRLEKADAAKIRSIHHGFDLSFFRRPKEAEIDKVRQRWNIPRAFPCIGVIARHIEWKGVQYIIPAFRKLLLDYPGACLVLANATGPYHNQVAGLLSDLPAARYRLISFEQDIASLYGLFDIYVHAPVDEICEAFGQTYVEALAAEVPSVFTRSGIAAEFVVHKKHAWVAGYKSSEQIYDGMRSLLQDPDMRMVLQREGRQAVRQFDIDLMIRKLEALYEE